jgi:membrane-associated phospholipid phosphatase
MDVVQFCADYLIYGVLLLAAVLLLIGVPRSKPWLAWLFVLLAGATAVGLSQLIHLLPLETVRPFQLMGVVPAAHFNNDPSFPSDHAVVAFVAVFAVAAMTKFRKWSLLLAVLAGVMVLARVWALVHSPLDILGGIGVAAVASLWYILYYRLRRRASSAHSESPVTADTGGKHD